VNRPVGIEPEAATELDEASHIKQKPPICSGMARRHF